MVLSVGKKYSLKGGCNNINFDLEGRVKTGEYHKMFVSNGSLGSIIANPTSPSCDICKFKSKICTADLEFTVNISMYTCVILETHKQLPTGEWIATRKVLVGRYRGQEMLDVRYEYEKRRKKE